MKKKKDTSKLKQYVILLILIGIFVFIFRFFTSGESAYNIQSGSSTFGSPVKKPDKELDESGHSEDFWTSGRFKW